MLPSRTLLWVLVWLTGVLQPVTLITLLLSGYSLDESLTAAGVFTVVAAEVAVRLLQSGAGGAGGQPPALGPALA